MPDVKQFVIDNPTINVKDETARQNPLGKTRIFLLFREYK